jgi:hypothetical protein
MIAVTIISLYPAGIVMVTYRTLGKVAEGRGQSSVL